MPLPSKQNEIYACLLNDIQDRYYPGAKLPTERAYARQLGVARQTLRSSLRRLEEEKRIVREKSGTYVLDENTGRCPGRKNNPGPVHVLLPCPDFMEMSNDSSIMNQQNLILGAMRAAVGYGTQVVTIPVSETNNPDDINWNQLAGLRQNDIVLWTGHWFGRVVPLLVERKCRMGCVINEDRNFPEIIGSGLDYIEYQRKSQHDSLPATVRFLKNKGIDNIACFVAATQSERDEYEDGFYADLLHEFPTLRTENLGLTDSLTPFSTQIEDLKEFYAGKNFDAMILVVNSFREQYVDIYQELSLPPSTVLVAEDMTFFDIAHPKRNANIWQRNRPFADAGFDLAHSLLGGYTGQDIRKFEIKFIQQEDFPK